MGKQFFLNLHTPLIMSLFPTKSMAEKVKPWCLSMGWCCDSRYWKYQIPYLENKYKIIVLDLAGHGHSGMDRKNYTMESFGGDVAAVVRKSCRGKVVLIGHSMGGPVAVEAGKILGEKVIGIIGVDTLKNITHRMDENSKEKMLVPLKENFRQGCKKIIKTMLRKDSSQDIIEWILDDMGAAPAKVAVSAMDNYLSQYVTGSLAVGVRKVKVPIVTVNGDLSHINIKENKKHTVWFDSIVMKNSDHFLHLTKPDEFNPNLERAIERILNYAEK